MEPGDVVSAAGGDRMKDARFALGADSVLVHHQLLTGIDRPAHAAALLYLRVLRAVPWDGVVTAGPKHLAIPRFVRPVVMRYLPPPGGIRLRSKTCSFATLRVTICLDVSKVEREK